jgi:hypothetical protein
MDLDNNQHKAVMVNFYYLSRNWQLPDMGVPYFFRGMEVAPNVVWTISSGCVLKFQDYSSLQVSGGLMAVAMTGAPIVFTSYEDDHYGCDSNADGNSTCPKPGNWGGIQFWDAAMDSACVLSGSVISYAGCNQKGGISTYNASPEIDSCEITANYIGLYVEGLSRPVITNCVIGSSSFLPLALSFEAEPVMSGNVLSFSDNKYDAIGIIPGTMQGNAHLMIRSLTDIPNMTYFLMGDMTVPAGLTLTIDKGITLKGFREDNYSRYSHLLVYGTLLAEATADSMITFTSARDDGYGLPRDCNKDGSMTSPAVGDWGGILFMPGSHGVLNACRFKYGQIWNKYFTSCNEQVWCDEAVIAIVDASPVISNCEFKDLRYGLFCYRDANPVLEKLKMINIERTPINLSTSSDPTISAITFVNVGYQALGLIGGAVCLDGMIRKRDVAGIENISYLLLSDMVIQNGSYVSVEPGIVCKLARNFGNTIAVDGGFKAIGTPTNPVVFTSLFDDNEGYDLNNDGNATKPQAGDWNGIKFRATSDDAYCLLKQVVLKYGGSNREGMGTFENSNAVLQQAVLTGSSGYGV